MATAILVIAFAQTLTADVPSHVSASSSSASFHEVDVIIVNQYNSHTISHDGKLRSSVVFYVSFWNIHDLPYGPFCRTPVWEYRGWSRNQSLVQCDGGWACQVNGNTIVAPRVLFVVSDYDFEYRNRAFGWGRLVTGR